VPHGDRSATLGEGALAVVANAGRGNVFIKKGLELVVRWHLVALAAFLGSQRLSKRRSAVVLGPAPRGALLRARP
jgi:hypothetical protein